MCDSRALRFSHQKPHPGVVLSHAALEPSWKVAFEVASPELFFTVFFGDGANVLPYDQKF